MPDITKPLSDEGARNLEDQLEEAKQQGAIWFGLCIRNGDADGLFARLRKAEAELAAAKAHKLVLRRALEEIRDEDDDRFKDMVPCLSLKSRGVIDRALRVTAPRAETEGSDA